MKALTGPHMLLVLVVLLILSGGISDITKDINQIKTLFQAKLVQ